METGSWTLDRELTAFDSRRMDDDSLAPRRIYPQGPLVPAVGIGCWALGGADTNLGLPIGWGPVSEGSASAGLRQAYQLGARVFDTADVYGHGRSERLIGDLIAEVGRANLVVVSKVGYAAGTSPHAYYPLHLRHQLEQTLDNLRSDYLDVYFLHNLNFGPADRYLDGAVVQLGEFKRQGLVRAVGLRGPHRFASDRLQVPLSGREDKYERFLRVLEAVRPDVVSARYHALSPEPGGGTIDIFDFTAHRGLGLLLYKPLAQGLLTGKYRPETPPRFGSGDQRRRKRWFTPDALGIISQGLEPLRARFGSGTADLVRVALRYCVVYREAVPAPIRPRSGLVRPPRQIG